MRLKLILCAAIISLSVTGCRYPEEAFSSLIDLFPNAYTNAGPTVNDKQSDFYQSIDRAADSKR